jgi:hypothetical protein
VKALSRTAALVALVAACSARTVEGPAPDRSPVVARVDGDAITADEVSHRAQAEHLSARDALQRCVRDRLLVREGLRRGLVNDDDAENARWHASVQMLIAREVEDKESPATIAPSFFEEIFRRRRVEFRHDGLVQVVHALARVEADAGVGAREDASRAIEAFRARLLATAGPRPTQAQFEGLAEQMHLHHETLPGFDHTGQAPDGTTFDPAFVQSAWSLSDTSPVSTPFTTRFGVHVALRLGSVPPLSRPVAEAQAIVVRDGVTLRRARALQKLLEDVRARTDVRVSETAVGASTPAAPAPAATH